MKRLVITIDGPCGAGKSTVALLLARRLGYTYLDTGALYRVVAFLAKEQGVSYNDDIMLEKIVRNIDFELSFNGEVLRISSKGRDFTTLIRDEEVSMGASIVSSRPVVREGLIHFQREFGKRGGVVAEGRDMGTVIFPDAGVKFFLDASLTERARRRYIQLKRSGIETDFNDLLREMKVRDDHDRNREIAPLKRAEDCIYIDSTDMTLKEIVDYMTEIVKEKVSLP